MRVALVEALEHSFPTALGEYCVNEFLLSNEELSTFAEVALVYGLLFLLLLA